MTKKYDEEYLELKRDLNRAYKVGDYNAVLKIQERLEGLYGEL